MSLPSRASDHLERTGGQSAGDELRRNGRVPDLRRYGPGQRSGRGGGARRRQVARKGATTFERRGVKGAEVEADGRQRSGAGSAIGGICAATKPRDAEVGATTSNKTKLAVINTDFAFFQITVLITYFFFSLSVRYNPNMCYLTGAVRSGRNTTLQVFRVKKMKCFKFFLTDFLLFC